MAEFIYDGPSHVFKKDDKDEGTKRGGIVNISEAVVDHLSQPKNGGHRFTKAADAKVADASEAKAVAKEPIPDNMKQPMTPKS